MGVNISVNVKIYKRWRDGVSVSERMERPGQYCGGRQVFLVMVHGQSALTHAAFKEPSHMNQYT